MRLKDLSTSNFGPSELLMHEQPSEFKKFGCEWYDPAKLPDIN